MAEEHGFQSPEGHRLCVNNCGFFGSPATHNMCSNCYRDLGLGDSGESSLFSTPLAVSPHPNPNPFVALPEKERVRSEAEERPQQPAAGRCSSCRKKVGLTGFRCRCGTTFCGGHRYPEMHGCTFDFKAVGREAIARANPLIKAEKLEKI